MKSLMLLMQEVLEDLGTWCCTSTTRDYNTVARRVEDEGWSFLTITLANFGTDFRKSLSQGYVGHDQFLSFSKAGGLPRFLGVSLTVSSIGIRVDCWRSHQRPPSGPYVSLH